MNLKVQNILCQKCRGKEINVSWGWVSGAF
jgi:hypothetical protein